MADRSSWSRSLVDMRHGVALTFGVALLAGAAALVPSLSYSAEGAVKIPPPSRDEAASATTETIVLAGGCFWGVQGVFQHVSGVTDAVSGYAGGSKPKPSYEEVSTGTTGHAESVRVTFDPKVVSLGSILQIYFSVAHNPTELNYQGPDEGTQYRSEIFTQNDKQKEIATAYIAELDARQGLLRADRHPRRETRLVLSRRDLSSELRDASSRRALYRL